MQISRIKKFISYNWDSLTIWLVTAILFLFIFLPFILNNSLDKFDTPGLISISWFMKEHTFPDFQGWNPFFYGGYPQGILYPPLFHYLVAGLGYVISIQTAFKIVVTISGLLIPLTVLAFTRRLYKSKKWEVLSTLGVIGVLLLLPGYLGFNFDGMIDYGLAPSFMSIPLFFLYLSQLFNDKHSIKILAIIFSALILTHLLTAAIAGLITLVLTILNLRKKGGELIFIGIISFLMTAFWTIPFLAFKEYSASGFAMRVSIIFPIATILISGTILGCIAVSKRTAITSRLLSLILISFIIACFGVLDTILNRDETVFSLPLIHPFRLQIYGLVLSIAAGPLLLKKILGVIEKRLKIIKKIPSNINIGLQFSVMIGAILVVLILSIIRINPSGVQEVILEPNTDWQGRVMRVYKVSEVLDQSRAVIDKSVMYRWNKFAVMGLLKESSYLAPYYQSLAKNVNTENYNWDELDSAYIENQQLSKEKTQYLMDLLWVKSLFTIDLDISNCVNPQRISTFKSNSQNDGVVDRDIYICDYAPAINSNFAEVVMTKPDIVESDWDKNVEEWWKSDSIDLFTDTEVRMPEDELDFIPIPQVNFNTDYRNLYVKTGIEEEVPVLLKMNYFPKWKAYDAYGNEVKIHRTSPNLMIVPVKESITLKYEMTSLEWTTLLISITTWMSFFTISIYIKLKLANRNN